MVGDGMSMIYDNIKAVCKHYGIRIAEIESPATKGFVSRYEARGKIHELPIYILNKLSEATDIPIDDIVKKDIASEIELAEIREQIERLKRREADIERKETEDATD